MGAIRIPNQPSFLKGRILGWYSHGITSGVMAKLLVSQYPDCEIVNCSSTMRNEHPDNARFMSKMEEWTGKKFIQLYSEKYYDIFDVFDKTGWLVGVGGARCTQELKRNVREKYQNVGDIHCFGMTAEEPQRVERFKRDNPELYLMFPLVDAGLTKQDCLNMVMRAGIALPAMYLLGYKNNNCIGCVKGGKGYWNKIRIDFPEYFLRMAQTERKMGVHILKDCYLDELDPTAGNYQSEYEIECGVTCGFPTQRAADGGNAAPEFSNFE
jgi:hypothetical protein